MSEGGTDSTPRRRRGPAYDRKTIDTARERRRYGDSYRAIGAALRVPPSTVQYWTETVIPDKSGRWRLSDAVKAVEPDAEIVMAEIGALMINSEGRVSGVTRDEARWVTLIARVRPDLLGSPGEVWHTARQFLEARAGENDQDDADIDRLEEIIALGSARLHWPDHEQRQERLREQARRVAADIRAGRNPFLDGRPYEPEGERA